MVDSRGTRLTIQNDMGKIRVWLNGYPVEVHEGGFIKGILTFPPPPDTEICLNKLAINCNDK